MIELDELVEFFKQRGVPSECPFCEQSQWTVLQDDDSPNVAVNCETNDGSVLGRYYPVIACVCKNCGFLRMHIRGVFDEWLEQEKNRQAELELEDSDNGDER